MPERAPGRLRRLRLAARVACPPSARSRPPSIAQQLRRLAGIDREVTVEPLPGDETGGQPGLGWRTRVQFAVRADGVAGLRAHRSHEVIDIGDCLIAHPGIRDLGIPRRTLAGHRTAVEVIVGSAAHRLPCHRARRPAIRRRACPRQQ